MDAIHLSGAVTLPFLRATTVAGGDCSAVGFDAVSRVVPNALECAALAPVANASGLAAFFGENIPVRLQTGLSAAEGALDPLWQGWATFVDKVYNLTSLQVAGAMIFGYAAAAILGLVETHRYRSESRLLDESAKIARDLGAPCLFDLIALRATPIQNLDELKLALQAYERARQHLKFHRSERADINDWLAAPKGRGPNEGVVTMRLAYGRIVQTLESKIRGFLIHLALKHSGDGPMDLQDRFVREYGEFIRVTSYETARDFAYPFRNELGWLKRRYEESRQALSLE